MTGAVPTTGICPHCHGTGRGKGTSVGCSHCTGTGVVSLAPLPQPARNRDGEATQGAHGTAALEPFLTFAQTFVEKTDDGWVWAVGSGSNRISDWFGPSDFGLLQHFAAALTRNAEPVVGSEEAAMVEALRFYADETNYDQTWGNIAHQRDPAVRYDRGRKARAALSPRPDHK